VRQRATVGKPGWNPALKEKEQTLDDLKFGNYFKEVFLDSDTKVACISSSPSHVDGDWFLTNEKLVKAGLPNVCIHKGLFPLQVEQKFPHLLGYSHVGYVRKPVA
jgi:hypothetical protein